MERTQEQIRSEAGQGGGNGWFWEGGWTPHPPLHPVPDNDWVGETWGLYYLDAYLLPSWQVCY